MRSSDCRRPERPLPVARLGQRLCRPRPEHPQLPDDGSAPESVGTSQLTSLGVNPPRTPHAIAEQVRSEDGPDLNASSPGQTAHSSRERSAQTLEALAPPSRDVCVDHLLDAVGEERRVIATRKENAGLSPQGRRVVVANIHDEGPLVSIPWGRRYFVDLHLRRTAVAQPLEKRDQLRKREDGAANEHDERHDLWPGNRGYRESMHAASLSPGQFGNPRAEPKPGPLRWRCLSHACRGRRRFRRCRLPPMLWHAYVDESGDRGWARRPAGTPPGVRLGSSEHFTMTAIVCPDGSQTAILDRWTDAAGEIGRRPGDALHWTSVKSHAQRMHLAKVVAGLDQTHVCSVVLSKWDMKNVSAIRQPNYLYGWALRLLVERLSWFATQQGEVVKLHFAQVKRLPPASIASYLTTLRQQETSINWESLVPTVGIGTPKRQRMLQVADTASGATFAAFEWDVYGNHEPRYLEIIKPQIWCHDNRPMQSYGLKVAPYPHPRHDWLEGFCSGK